MRCNAMPHGTARQDNKMKHIIIRSTQTKTKHKQTNKQINIKIRENKRKQKQTKDAIQYS